MQVRRGGPPADDFSRALPECSPPSQQWGTRGGCLRRTQWPVCPPVPQWLVVPHSQLPRPSALRTTHLLRMGRQAVLTFRSSSQLYCCYFHFCWNSSKAVTALRTLRGDPLTSSPALGFTCLGPLPSCSLLQELWALWRGKKSKSSKNVMNRWTKVWDIYIRGSFFLSLEWQCFYLWSYYYVPLKLWDVCQI